MAETWDKVVDIVIVGSGAGSMVAALKAKRLGLEAVIIEKRAQVGGSTGFSGGILWVPGNPVMEREGDHDDLAAARRYVDAAAPDLGPAGTAERRDAYVRSGPEVIAFLEQEGMAFVRATGFPDYYTTLPGASAKTRSLVGKLFNVNELGNWKQRLSVSPLPPMPLGIQEVSTVMLAKATFAGKLMALRLGLRFIRQKITGQDVRGFGAAIQGRMLKLSLDNGIDIRPETPFQSFVVESGRVVGVVARHDGRSLRIGARRGVILNAGGFAHNDEMRTRYGRPGSAARTHANPGETGEVLVAAMELGAAVDCMDEAIWVPTSLGPNGALPPGVETCEEAIAHFAHGFDISSPHSVIVDHQGRRFANEAGSYMEFGQRLHQRHKEIGGPVPAWAILESRHRKRYGWARHLGATPKEWLDSGYMIQAGSIEELAGKTGIPVDNLKQTIERFNEFAKRGVDEDFHRGEAAFDQSRGDPSSPSPNLGAIERPPFYAVRMFAGDVGTIGGIVTDADARALGEDGSVIPGLYVVGNTAAPAFGKRYIGAGTSIAAGMIFGYRAVDAMAREQV